MSILNTYDDRDFWVRGFLEWANEADKLPEKANRLLFTSREMRIVADHLASVQVVADGKARTNALLREIAIRYATAILGDDFACGDVGACKNAESLVAEMRKRDWLEWETHVDPITDPDFEVKP